MQNARLIAAAPNMLTALQEIQRSIRLLIRDDRLHATLSRKDLAEKIYAAIAKATGTDAQAIGAEPAEMKEAAN